VFNAEPTILDFAALPDLAHTHWATVPTTPDRIYPEEVPRPHACEPRRLTSVGFGGVIRGGGAN